MSENSNEGIFKGITCSLCNEPAEMVFITPTPNNQGGMINQLENSCNKHIGALENNIEHSRGLKKEAGYQVKSVKEVYSGVKK